MISLSNRDQMPACHTRAREICFRMHAKSDLTIRCGFGDYAARNPPQASKRFRSRVRNTVSLKKTGRTQRCPAVSLQLCF